ncbi:sugar dehydratase [Candidatus Aerophobetes bacterium]|uniref:Sugar dehydratase n=1 Tax=Aerophobetes bacterium TaxID=2030807 RepID=A0A2A4YJH9_UNCAE|nr:MAG: sugar dehydratase [Candidatus Aerophobetes bacterium]
MNKYWNGKNVFVTGATGFIGSWLTKHLVDLGANVVTLVRDQNPQSELIRSGYLQKIQIVNGDLENYKTIERAICEYQIDTVYHLGAQTQVTNAIYSPRNTFETNIRGTYNLLEACRLMKRFVKCIIIASSDKAYGESECLPLTEKTPLNAIYPYDVSKACTDLIALSYYHTYDLPVAITRSSNVYGGGDFNWDRLIPGVIRSLFRDQRPVLRSDGSFLRDYLFIEDMVYGYLILGKKFLSEGLMGQVFNFGTNSPQTVLEICDHLAKFIGKEHLKPVFENTAEAEIKDQYLSIEKAQNLLNWKPRCELSSGLELTVDWYRQYFAQKNLEKYRTSTVAQFVTELI